MDLALFDFDGTITDRETFAGFVRASIGRRRRWLGGMAVMPHYLGYKLGWLSGERVRLLRLRLSTGSSSSSMWRSCLNGRY